MSNDLPGVDRAKLEALKAEADAAMEEDAADAAEESPRARSAREEAARAASIAKWNKRLSEAAARNRGRSTEADDALQGDDARPEQPPEPEAIDDPPQPPPSGYERRVENGTIIETGPIPAATSTASPARPSSSPEPKAPADRKRRKDRQPKAKPEAPKVDAHRLTEELAAAPWDDAALDLLARIVYARRHDAAVCPKNRRPPDDALHEWWADCSDETRRQFAPESAAILRDLALALGDTGEPFRSVQFVVNSDGRIGVGLIDFATAEPIERGIDPDTGEPFASSVQDLDPVLDALQRLRTPGGSAAVLAQMVEDGANVDPAELHALWCQCPPELRRRHPLASIVAAWQELAPFSVKVETRADRRIMPALRVVGPAPERERGVLFGGLVDDRPRSAELSLFPEMEPERHRVPLLEIVDAAGVPLRSKGRGAPIEARLIVRGGLLMIRPEDRGRTTVRIAVTVGELLDGLYPTAGRKRNRRRIAQQWPTVEAALRKARDFTVPDGTGGRWFPMALRRLPTERPEAIPAGDDLVVLDLAPPPGATTGPSVDLPALDDMGATSGPKWRAYIAGRSLVWLPGKTRRPLPRQRRRFGWSADPEDYPMLTLADLRRLAFGDGDAKNRTRAAIIAPWEDLPDVVALPGADARTGIRGYRLLPTEAEQAVRRAHNQGARA